MDSPLIIMDLTDYSVLETYLPEQVRGGLEIQTEDVLNLRRNAVVRYWRSWQERLDFELVLINQGNPISDVKAKWDWLRKRSAPVYAGDLILQPPRRFAIGGVEILDEAAEWELGNFVTWSTEGRIIPPVMLPNILRVQLSFVRVDNRMGVLIP